MNTRLIAPGPQRLAAAAELLTLTVKGSAEELAHAIHPEATNREAIAEPPAARVPGPAGFVATGEWLRTAYSDMVFTVHEAVVDGDLLVTHGTMSGRHTGPFVVWNPAGEIERVFTPTGRSFTVNHTHWLRFSGEQIIEHWANRDDQGQAMQLGWVPPTPAYLLRCALATRKARRVLAQG